MKVSVIFVTKRTGAIEYLNKQLGKQTFKDFEVIIANDSDDKGGFKPRQKKDSDVWNINKAYNDCLDKAKGELLVFLQDFIWIPANVLQRFVNQNRVVTGCGHKYKEDLKTIDEIDDRALGEKKIEECHWSQWELNWSSCPRDIMPRFDEEMDKNYGAEDKYIAKELYNKGYKIYLDKFNECKGLSQEICGGRPDDWEPRHFNKTNKWKIWSSNKGD